VSTFLNFIDIFLQYVDGNDIIKKVTTLLPTLQLAGKSMLQERFFELIEAGYFA
jgi:hypothetical protein